MVKQMLGKYYWTLVLSSPLVVTLALAFRIRFYHSSIYRDKPNSSSFSLRLVGVFLHIGAFRKSQELRRARAPSTNGQNRLSALIVAFSGDTLDFDAC